MLFLLLPCLSSSPRYYSRCFLLSPRPVPPRRPRICTSSSPRATGSACNQLNICNNNDIDVCLELPALLAAAAAAAAAKKEKEREQNKSNGGEESGDEGRGGGAEGRGGGREGDTSDHDAKAAVILKLEEVLAESGVMTDLLALPKARVPVIKFTYAPTATRVDVTVNNMLATVNTQLLRAYAEVDPRLRQLVYVIKYWAKQRRVNDAYRGTLSSYAYVIMCVALLQQRSPAVLPCLQVRRAPRPAPPSRRALLSRASRPCSACARGSVPRAHVCLGGSLASPCLSDVPPHAVLPSFLAPLSPPSLPWPPCGVVSSSPPPTATTTNLTINHHTHTHTAHQAMEPTFRATIDGWACDYYDRVDELQV